MCPNFAIRYEQYKDYGGLTVLRVLPVRQGDAYVLKGQRGSYLIDGGDMSGRMPEMLRERRAGKFRAAVCTFPSPERLGGIIDLLESEYPVNECWLPASLVELQMLAARFCGDWPGWLQACGHSGVEAKAEPAPATAIVTSYEQAAALLELAYSGLTGQTADAFCKGSPEDRVTAVFTALVSRTAGWADGESRRANALLDMFRAFRGTCTIGAMALLCGRLIYNDMAGQGRIGRKQGAVVRPLALAAMAAILMNRHAGNIRYFRQTGRLEEQLVPRHHFKCLNGIETEPGKGIPESASAKLVHSAALRCLSSGEGLVFQYGDSECGALFCGESRFSFLGKRESVVLTRPTVIAAPAQGTVSCERAFNHIESSGLGETVWVRSHVSYARKISDSFKRQKHAYCLYNCVHRAVQEILLSHKDGRWRRLAGGVCAGA